MNDGLLTYSVRSGIDLKDAEWSEVSELFSRAYGFYSQKEPFGKAGKRIRLGLGYYQRSYATEDYQIALCRDSDRLVAEAVFRTVNTSRGLSAFVVQLVVDEDYRRRGIASTLLHAIWGFSDYYCWGIVTSNVFTIESLEAATFRRACPEKMEKHQNFIREEILSGIGFLKNAEWRITNSESVIDSNFYTDRSQRPASASMMESRMGVLPEGSEWLAVVFRDQRLDDLSGYASMIAASSRFVIEAYSRMPQKTQGWASHSDSEVAAIMSWLPEIPRAARIADFGAGSGRHIEALRKVGFMDLTAVDFAQSGSDIIKADVRTWRSSDPFDLIFCLYDVIGSFPDDADNEAVIASIASNLKSGGSAVLSVSNFGFVVGKGAENVDLDDSRGSLEKIFSLLPSRTMETTGEFFNPNFILIDEKRHVVCRKEQFSAATGLPGEFLMRDRRFTIEEITQMVERNGLVVKESHFVRAGFDVEHDAVTGKEILLITKKQ